VRYSRICAGGCLRVCPCLFTALASWCEADGWISGLPVAEAVPMLFRMGPDHYFPGGDFRSALRSRPAEPPIPSALPADAVRWMKADRAYQIAAAEFYAGQFDAASADFLRIAGDRLSPWHGIASYLAARAPIREATIVDPAAAPAAQEQLRKVLADPDAAPWHEGARGLAFLACANGAGCRDRRTGAHCREARRRSHGLDCRHAVQRGQRRRNGEPRTRSRGWWRRLPGPINQTRS
jgi:hypothetical protein